LPAGRRDLEAGRAQHLVQRGIGHRLAREIAVCTAVGHGVILRFKVVKAQTYIRAALGRALQLVDRDRLRHYM
jgi:hypothetical protein